MTATNANITTLEAENAALRQRVSNLEACLASSNGVTATTTNHAIIEELHGFRTLVETAPQAIALANIDGMITYANPAFHELTGYDTLIGVSLMALHFEEDLPTIQANVQDVTRSGVWRGSGRLRHRNGHAIP
ncbi:PAS domain-containing protein, partial [Roseiflexus castenholzii]|uniref:PAS domain-containing protein n=1 Tax=Roseiflexus castenholzii TaxID=120962 RepID=UPI003C7E285F